MGAQGFRPAAFTEGDAVKKHKIIKCIDCACSISAKGGKKRCYACSDTHRAALQRQYERKKKA